MVSGDGAIRRKKNVVKHSYHYTAKLFVYKPNGSFDRMVTYRNIDARRAENILRFEKFCRKQFLGAHHVNYYEGDTKQFVKQARF